MNSHHHRVPSDFLGRRVHVWTHGERGLPVLVFPSAAGMAHEWQHSGAVDTLRPWIERGRIRLICPESNVSEAWTGPGAPQWRLERHRAYERFVAEELLPWARADRVIATGCSFGAFYTANFALKNPERTAWALGLSGRYRTEAFLGGFYDDRVYFADPLHYVPNLQGSELARVRRTRLTLVVGRGAFEGRCIGETADLARVLLDKGIPVRPDFWGPDVSHHWDWWKRQLRTHFGRELGPA